MGGGPGVARICIFILSIRIWLSRQRTCCRRAVRVAVIVCKVLSELWEQAAYWSTAFPYMIALMICIGIYLPAYVFLMNRVNVARCIVGRPQLATAFPHEALLPYYTPHCHFG